MNTTTTTTVATTTVGKHAEVDDTSLTTLPPLPTLKPKEWTLYGHTLHLEHFLQTHPGGDIALLLGANRDCTRLFEQYHMRPPSLVPFGIITKTPLTEKRKHPQKNAAAASEEEEDGSAFHAELLKAVRELPHTKATPLHVLLCTLLFVFTVSCWIGWTQGSYIALVFLPCLHWLLTVNVAHDAAHFAFSRNPVINEYLAMLSSPIFYNTTHWYLQHNVSHHGDTNEPGKDVDLSHYSIFARLHAKAPWRSLHSLQVLVVGASFFMTTLVESLLFPFITKYQSQFFGTSSVIETRTRVSAWIQIAFSLFVLVYPWFYFSSWKAFLFCAFPFFAASLLFMCVTQISHIQEDQQQGTARSKGGQHWTLAQVESSLDYAQSSTLITFLTGGLNSQGLHHCLPFLSSSRFVSFYPTYRRICKKHGIRIYESHGFGDSFCMYARHVWNLSDKYFLR